MLMRFGDRIPWTIYTEPSRDGARTRGDLQPVILGAIVHLARDLSDLVFWNGLERFWNFFFCFEEFLE